MANLRAVTIAIVALALCAGAPVTAQAEINGKVHRENCGKQYTITQFAQYTKPKYRRQLNTSKSDRHGIAVRTQCQRSDKKERRAKELRTAYEIKRWNVWHWDLAYFDEPAGWRWWASSTASCEGGKDPNIHNSTKRYHGTFQFLLSTWWSAQKYVNIHFYVDPHTLTYRHQAVVSIELAQHEGTGHWPVCG